MALLTPHSRSHAQLRVSDELAVFVADLDSAHGTRLDGRRLPPHEEVELRPSAVLTFGRSARRYLVRMAPRSAQKDLKVRHSNLPQGEVI